MAGFSPEVIVSGVDEDDVADLPILEQVATLALRKASAVLEQAGDAVVVGCDSMLALDGAALGKPRDAQDAIARWKAMRGRAGVLTTGHCVFAGGKHVVGVAETTVRFGNPSDDEIAAYVATGEPLAVAGAFTLDGISAPFIAGIEGDPGAVIGISLPLLRTLLGELGVSVVDLWA